MHFFKDLLWHAIYWILFTDEEYQSYKEQDDVYAFFVRLPIWNQWIHGNLEFYHAVTVNQHRVVRIYRYRLHWIFVQISDLNFVFFTNW